MPAPMTTLQTQSTHSQYSADPAIERAQLVSRSADGAQGFAGVLDAFSSEQPSAIDEIDSREDQTAEGTESEHLDSEESAENSEQTDQSVGSNHQSESNGSDDASKAGVQSDSNADLKEAVPIGRITSASEITALLSNAARIDLAGLATQQLEGQETAAKSPSQGEKASVNPDSVRHDPHRFNKQVIESQGAQSTKAPKTPLQGTQQNQIQNHSLQSAPQQIDTSRHQRTEQQVQLQAQVNQVVQASQAVVADTKTQTQRLDGIRSISDAISSVGAQRTISSTESGAKTGDQHAGMDLGNRAKNAAQRLQDPSSADRAVLRKQIMAQVQRGLASIMNTKGGTMKIRLSPEHLGEVNIKMTTNDGHVRVEIDASQSEARLMLKEGLEGLRSAMESRGVQVDELRITGSSSSEFAQQLGDAGKEDLHNKNQHDQQHPSGDEGMRDQDEDQQDTNEPRGIWTELGLDAIA